jgi:hypothetical protein
MNRNHLWPLRSCFSHLYKRILHVGIDLTQYKLHRPLRRNVWMLHAESTEVGKKSHLLVS